MKVLTMVTGKVPVFCNVTLCSLMFWGVLLPVIRGCQAAGHYALLIQFYQTVATYHNITFIFHTFAQPVLCINLIHIQSSYQIQTASV
jgi:hypothetical protein